ncbi:PREDICTED: synaptonemal complex protein 1-like isoform X1 [Ceratosolen solmsi marchali]|uniref:Synaptonemal complex protein 1-like isoform X1 n=1 Tax=Ceratosolen solmsi marchali TaxID=326594 RepID=A0AAJ7E0J2_9HYME|nr:PREDICTED: synaptonemal complex protein 1-like isoform X1 [Ceratosolen solmsi marchali]XP_011503220.1 PREDICTED: synaptonemal complex protein 1-like isoform X1 [Ceratosolen solmsi marchali]XP_011503221.1 PREDICTED: synaptonemal complex protein 1-like isoform X1 [Ceratosolen solmsi marchali]XP_011503222.1 PREDICTED: synaptonemal complex protein 1-like isoform X1 [Ceratosolen solmsi marchali]XP_011503223.1 PREDICTED: synaptonemal complex protein 1-like isoform X1 [Ceratosolen solmsi marchali]
MLSSPTVHFHEQSSRCEKNLLRTYRNRIETLSTIVEELENQNEKLKQKLMYYHNVSTSDEIPHLHLRIKQLMTEITSLKNNFACLRLMEVHELKTILEKHHKEIVDQYKIKMTEHFKKMKHQLENARSENEDLNNKIAVIETKLQELNREKKEFVKVSEEQWLHKLECTKIEYEKMLQEKELQINSRDEMVRQKEVQLTQKLNEIDSLCEQIKELQQLVEIKTQDDGKLQSMLIEQHKSIMEELSKMRNNIEIASRQQTETHQQEKALLKKNVMAIRKNCP